MNFNIYTVGFGEATDESSDILGGKGYGLVKMHKIGVPVPPAVILPTTLCADVNNGVVASGELAIGSYPYLAEIEKQFGYMPLFSVRSGAKVSCPGMCETILNVGLTSSNIGFWEKKIGERAAWDSYRRLIQMFGDVVFGISSSKYELIMDDVKAAELVSTDAELSVVALKTICELFLGITPDFPQSFKMQLRKAIKAVYGSWNTERAIKYRDIHNISHNLGTAVIIQAMVFGNQNDKSATGVLFTRNPATGENKIVGEFLVNAQGEDVVSGVRTPLPIEDMPKIYEGVIRQETAEDGEFLDAYLELLQVASKLETHFGDMQDVEFTIQDGKLFILQTRNAKRTALAAVKVAVDLAKELLIDKKTAFSRLTYDQYLTANRPVIDPSFNVAPTGKGIPASTGFATGVAVFSSEKAVELAKSEPVILLSKETTPEDIAGMDAAVGILTQTGGSSCHAAVVARGMDKVCVVGCLDLTQVDSITEGKKCWALGDKIITEGVTKLTLEGNTGAIWVGVDVPLTSPENTPEIAQLDSWVKELVPFFEKTTKGKSGYLDTCAFDSNPSDLIEVAKYFDGIISLGTGKSNIEDYDAPLFELVRAFDEEGVIIGKVNALCNDICNKSIINPPIVDPCGFTLKFKTKKALENAGYHVVSEVNSLEDLILSDGFVKFGGKLANKYEDATKKLLALKEKAGEQVVSLVFAGDSLPAPAKNEILIATKEVVMKSLMSA